MYLKYYFQCQLEKAMSKFNICLSVFSLVQTCPVIYKYFLQCIYTTSRAQTCVIHDTCSLDFSISAFNVCSFYIIGNQEHIIHIRNIFTDLLKKKGNIILLCNLFKLFVISFLPNYFNRLSDRVMCRLYRTITVQMALNKN